MVSINGKNLKTDLGIDVKMTFKLPGLPPTRDRSLLIPNKHGTYDMGGYMEPVPHALPCRVSGTMVEVQTKIKELTKLLIGGDGRPKTVELRYPFEAEKWHNVRYSGSLETLRNAVIGDFTLPLVNFESYYYASQTAYDPSDAPNYDEGTEYDSEVEYINQTHTPFTNIKQYVGIYNYSHYSTPFSFMIEGAVVNPSITNTTTGKKITFTNLTVLADERLYVDSKKKTTWKLKAIDDDYYWLTPNMMMQYPSEWEKINVYHEFAGDWLELIAEGNTLLFEGESPDASVNFNWEHRFL